MASCAQISPNVVPISTSIGEEVFSQNTSIMFSISVLDLFPKINDYLSIGNIVLYSKNVLTNKKLFAVRKVFNTFEQ